MKILEITQGDAIKAYNNAEEKGKQLLEDLFGKDKFNQKITDLVKSYEDACIVIGIDLDLGISCSKSGVWKEIENIAAYAKLIVIAKALNEGWTPNWEDDSEYKYVPWFKHKSGVGLSFGGVDSWSAHTNIGSRLCFKTSELAEYAATQFADIYKDYLTIQ
jgi:hypothetical protein